MRKMNIIVMALAGLLLIAAAILKFHEMVSVCVPSWQANASLLMQSAEAEGAAMPVWKGYLLGFWESYEFLLLQIPLEFALGVWMVSGLFRKAAWVAGTLAYFVFIIVTLIKALLGLESCGCFGQVRVDPWITLFSVDVPLFLLLAIFRPKGVKLLPPPWPNVYYLLAVFVVTMGVMVLIPPTLVAFQPDCIKTEDQQPDASAQLKLQIYQLKQDLRKQTETAESLRQQVQDRQQIIRRQEEQIQSLRQQVKQLQETEEATTPEPNVVEPAQEGSLEEQAEEPEVKPVQQTTEPDEQPAPVDQWEWLEYVVEDDVREQLSTGLVAILMYHHDCPDCARMAPRYSQYYAEMLEQGNEAFKIAFLALPPHEDDGPIPDDTKCIHGKLSEEQNLLVASPYVVVLLDGELMKTWPEGTAPEPENILDEVFGQ